MKHIILLIIIQFVVFCGGNVSVNGQNAANKKAAKFLSINEINEQQLDGKVVRTEGYVVKIFRCPPCPPDTFCKPCMPDNAVISTENSLLESYAELTEKEIIIFGIETGKLKKGKKYRFTLKITDRKTTGQSLNDTELVSYKLIE